MQDPLFVENVHLNCNFTVNEVKNAVIKSKLGKSPGIDQLPNEVFKNDLITSILHKMFQFCFDVGKVPSVWRKALITPIPKDDKADARVPLNYCGISLICCSAKLYTSLLNVRLCNFSDDGQLIVDEQNGFRKNRSCQDDIFVFNICFSKKQVATWAKYIYCIY